MDELVGEVNSAPIKFSIFTRSWDPKTREFVPGALKAYKDADGKMHLKGIASSTVKDLHGDTMLSSALEDMERAANNDLTIFGNHEYKVPEDVYGTVTTARMKAAGEVDTKGDPIYDLDFDVRVNEVNERAVKTWQAIDNGTKLGMSIGAMIPEGGAVREKKSGAYTIAHVELLETSIVGIPANPRSWVQYAVKGLLGETRKGATTVPLGAPELTLDTDEGTYQIKGSLSDVGLVSVRNKDGSEFGVGEADIPEDAVLVSKHEQCGETVEGTFENGICSKCGATGPFLAEWVIKDGDLPANATPIETNADPEVVNATCPDCGRSDSGKGCQNPYHSKADSAVPEVTDAKVTIIEVDTGDSGGSSSESGSEGSEDGDIEMAASAEDAIAAVKSVTQGLDAPIAGTIQSLLDLTNGLLNALTESKTREAQALAAKAAAEQDRDNTVRVAGDLITRTNALVQRLGDLRVGPKTLVTEAADELDDIRGIYSEGFLDMLKGNVK